METITEKSSKQLKKLIIINNDRYEGYKTAANETDEPELKALFEHYSHQSKEFSDELQKLLPDSSYSPEPGETKNTGKLYRIYMDLKATIAGKDRKAILASCEYGEDVAKEAYDKVLENQGGIDEEIVDIIRKQRIELQKGHDKIKVMRDSL